MTKIKLTNLKYECQLSSLNAFELKQVVGGSIMSLMMYHGMNFENQNTSWGQTNKALIDARDAAEQAGDVNRANELDAIINGRWFGVLNGIPQSAQIVAPG